MATNATTRSVDSTPIAIPVMLALEEVGSAENSGVADLVAATDAVADGDWLGKTVVVINFFTSL